MKAKAWLVECKFTDNTQFTLKLTDLNKLKLQAIMERKFPVLQIQFGKRRYAVIEWEDLFDAKPEEAK